MGGDLNARKPTEYIFNGAVGSIDTPPLAPKSLRLLSWPCIDTPTLGQRTQSYVETSMQVKSGLLNVF